MKRLIFEIQRKFGWLLDEFFYIKIVENGPEYTVCYESLDERTRVIVHLEQKEPLVINVAQFVEGKWKRIFLGDYVNLKKEFTSGRFYALYDLGNKAKILEFLEDGSNALQNCLADIVKGK